jgi:hemerythrin
MCRLFAFAEGRESEMTDSLDWCRAEHDEIKGRYTELLTYAGDAFERGKVCDALDRCIQQMKNHFRREEELVGAYDPEGLEAHARSHVSVVLFLVIILDEVQIGQISDTVYLSRLADFEAHLMAHVTLMDDVMMRKVARSLSRAPNSGYGRVNF